jgi:hypothetical protein
MNMEREEKEWRRRVEERALETQAQAVQFKRTLAHEAWDMFKQPVGMLITAALAWTAWYYFTVPTAHVPEAATPPQEEHTP